MYYFCYSHYMHVMRCSCPTVLGYSVFILFSLLFSFQDFLLIFSRSEIFSSIMQSTSKPIRGSLLQSGISFWSLSGICIPLLTLPICVGYCLFWRRKWKATLIFLPGKPHGQRSLVGYSPWGCKESDTT